VVGKKLVEMGIITKKLQKQFGIDNPVYYAEMNWTQLMKATKKTRCFTLRYPSSLP
jgi:hypothetical protein